MNTILLKRGILSSLPPLSDGEIALCEDEQSLYCGIRGKNVRVAKDVRIFYADKDFPNNPLDYDVCIHRVDGLHIYFDGQWFNEVAIHSWQNSVHGKTFGTINDLDANPILGRVHYAYDVDVVNYANASMKWVAIRLETDKMIRSVTMNATISWNEKYLLVDATNTDVIITLPHSSASNGKDYVIKRVDNSPHSVYVRAQGMSTIDGEVQIKIAEQYEAVKLVSNGLHWFIV